MTSKQNITGFLFNYYTSYCLETPKPPASLGRFPPLQNAHAPRRFVGSPVHRASPGSPGPWTRGPDSARWTTGCGKERVTVKEGPAVTSATQWMMPFPTISAKMTCPLSTFASRLPPPQGLNVGFMLPTGKGGRNSQTAFGYHLWQREIDERPSPPPAPPDL